jgi:succinyl-CoA---D-citramalate CoA-transferase
VPRLSETPGEIRWLGEGLRSANDDIYRGLLGLRDDELVQMREAGVI